MSDQPSGREPSLGGDRWDKRYKDQDGKPYPRPAERLDLLRRRSIDYQRQMDSAVGNDSNRLPTRADVARLAGLTMEEFDALEMPERHELMMQAFGQYRLAATQRINQQYREQLADAERRHNEMWERRRRDLEREAAGAIHDVEREYALTEYDLAMTPAAPVFPFDPPTPEPALPGNGYQCHSILTPVQAVNEGDRPHYIAPHIHGIDIVLEPDNAVVFTLADFVAAYRATWQDVSQDPIPTRLAILAILLLRIPEVAMYWIGLAQARWLRWRMLKRIERTYAARHYTRWERIWRGVMGKLGMWASIEAALVVCIAVIWPGEVPPLILQGIFATFLIVMIFYAILWGLGEI